MPYRRDGAPRSDSTSCSIATHRRPNSGMWIGCRRKSAPIRTDAPTCTSTRSSLSWRASRSHGAWAFDRTDLAKRCIAVKERVLGAGDPHRALDGTISAIEEDGRSQYRDGTSLTSVDL